MKVPHTYTGRTKPSSQGLAYLRPASSVFGGKVAEALSGLGANVGLLAEKTEERNDRTERFAALRGLNGFQQRYTEAITEAKRSTVPGTTSFVDTADSIYTTLENDFIQREVPAHLQDEFRLRTSDMRQGVVGDALEFQYTQQDAFYRTEIDKAYTQAKVGVGQSPDTMQEWNQSLAELIQSTDLPTEDKVALARQIEGGLAAVTYGKKIENLQRESLAGTEADELSAMLLMYFEGFVDTAKFDVNAYRVGFGSDTITRADGTIEAVTKDTVVTVEDAERDLARRIPEFRQTATTQVGMEVWQQLGPDAQAALTSVAYNYGKLPGSVVRAVQSGDREAIASAVEALPDNPKRRKKEATVIRGGRDPFGDLDTDPTFAGVSFEDRMAMRADAGRRVASEETERLRLGAVDREARINSLLVNIQQRAAGETDIKAAMQAGWLTNINDITKAYGLLEQEDIKQAKRLQIQSMLDDPNTAPGYNVAEDNDAFNEWLGEEGLAKVSERDVEFTNGSVLPAIQRLQDVPTELVGQLTSMTRAADPTHAQYAFETLAAIQDIAPQAFTNRTSEDLSRDVHVYRALQNTARLEDWLTAVRGGRTPQEVNASRALEEEAQTLLRKGEVESGVGANEGWFAFDVEPGTPTSRVELQREWDAAFTYYYSQIGDRKKAKNAADAQLQEVWGLTNIGGSKYMMRLPPKKAGYPALEPDGWWGDGWEGYEDQVRADLGISDDEEFRLVHDQTTAREVALHREGKLGRLPSYAVTKVTADGRTVPFDPARQRWYGVANAAP